MFGKLFGSSGYAPSGSKGKPGRGYEKGKASSNPSKYKPRTEAQARRAERKLDRFDK
jgi:hypothetical protein